MRKLNLGCGQWKKEGWDTLDHNRFFLTFHQAWNLPYPDNIFDQVFTSHMIEHIPSVKIEETLCEINRVMKQGGIMRILTPDLRKLAEAYVNNDWEAMRRYIAEDGSGIQTELGMGGSLMNFISAPGFDNVVLSSDYSEVLGSYGHVYCYDRQMLGKLLEHYGFTIDERNSDIDRSEISEHKTLRDINYDRERGHGLVVECRKIQYIPFDPNRGLIKCGSYKREWIVPSRHGIRSLSFKGASLCYVAVVKMKSLLSRLVGLLR